MTQHKKGGFLSFLSGLAMGAAAVFFSKKENREKTKDMAEDTVKKAKKLQKNLKENPEKIKKEAQVKVQEAVAQVKKTAQTTIEDFKKKKKQA